MLFLNQLVSVIIAFHICVPRDHVFTTALKYLRTITTERATCKIFSSVAHIPAHYRFYLSCGGTRDVFPHISSRISNTRLNLRTSKGDDDGTWLDDDELDESFFDERFGSSNQPRELRGGRDVDGQSRQRRNRPVLFSGQSKWQVINRAIVAGIFVAGIGTGITIDSAINTNPKDLASRDAIDRNAPNPKLCAQYGSSAMVLDERVFITFNPFNVFVTQADTKPGCVLRPANVVSQLQKERQLITNEEVAGCKNGYNTWAFVGDINSNPQLNCVFQSDDAQNEFLSNPKVGLGEDVYDDSLPSKPKQSSSSSSSAAAVAGGGGSSSSTGPSSSSGTAGAEGVRGGAAFGWGTP